MEFLTVFQHICSILSMLVAICFSYQIVYLILPFFHKKTLQSTAATKRYAILIPARNEEAVIPHLLDSIAAQDYPAHLISTFVIADNCTDNTAAVAQAHGATVFNRSNREQVGKGFALQYLLDQIHSHIGLDQFDAFLVFDADNLLEPDYLTQINRTCCQGYEAFCGYRNTKNYGSNWISASYALWYLHESSHMNRSRMMLGTCCSVSGTGFGFTRRLLERLGGWHFFTLTEDLEFNAWCATQGIRIGYCHDAILYDEQPTTFRQSWRQRTRWVQGGFQVSLRYAGAYLRGICKLGRTGYSSFDMATLSFWGFALATLNGFCAFLNTLFTGGLPGFLHALILALVTAYGSLLGIGLLTLLSDWKRIRTSSGRKILSLFCFPFFMMSYLPICATALFRKFQWLPISHTVAISHTQLK